MDAALMVGALVVLLFWFNGQATTKTTIPAPNSKGPVSQTPQQPSSGEQTFGAVLNGIGQVVDFGGKVWTTAQGWADSTKGQSDMGDYSPENDPNTNPYYEEDGSRNPDYGPVPGDE